MRKNKLFISLIFSLTFISGCTFEYNVEITKDNIKEDNIVYIEGSTKKTIKKDVENLVNKYTGPTNSLGMYNISVIKNNAIYGASYKRDYKISDYKYSASFSACYDHYKILQETDKITISTSKEFKCFKIYEELENVKINVVTDLDVISSNADIIDGNKYIWNITKDNANNKVINIVLNKNTETKVKKTIGALTFIICAAIVFGIIALVIMARGKRKNKIK